MYTGYIYVCTRCGYVRADVYSNITWREFSQSGMLLVLHGQSSTPAEAQAVETKP